jgi:hypothetical protein
MKKTLRFLVLSAALAVMAVPVFADGGPGSGDPLPPGSPTGTSTATGNSTAAIVAVLLGYLGL